MTPKAGDLLNEVGAVLDRLERALPRELSATEVSPTAKVPFKVLMCRAVLAWRFVELSRSVLNCIEMNTMASAVVLTRAVLETGAAAWYLNGCVTKALQSGSIVELNDHVMRVLHGSRTTPEAPKAINVLTFVDAVDKDVGGFRHHYDGLSEFAHPNWAGAMYLYCRADREARSCSFGPDGEAIDNTKLRVAAVMAGTCLIAEKVIGDLLAAKAALVVLSERALGGAV